MIAEINVGIIGVAGFVLLAMGLVFVAILTIASAKLKVEQDPTVEAILAALPGANCGGCGLAGCSAYAEAVVADHGLMGKCGPGGEALVKEIAAILGIEAAASAPIRAVIHCSAKKQDRIDLAEYRGIQSCREAQVIAGAQGCPYGCLGYGDCALACEFDAILIQDGLAIVDYHKCVGCGACVKACPRQIIELVPMKEDPMLVIACSTRDKAKDVRGYCNIGCVGCGLCAKLSPTTFQMKQNLAVIDYTTFDPRGDFDKAVEKCPRAIMIYVGKNAKAAVSSAAS